MHRFPEALDQIEQAQRLEPSSTAILADKGFLLWTAGRQNEGIALLKQLETTEPFLSSTHNYLGKIYWDAKNYPAALSEWKRLAELRHDQAGLAIAAAREKGFAAGGLQGMWESEFPVRKDLFDRGLGSAYELAEICSGLGKTKDARQYLQIAFDRREANLLTGDYTISSLTHDPLFQQLEAQVREKLAQ